MWVLGRARGALAGAGGHEVICCVESGAVTGDAWLDLCGWICAE